MLVYMNISENPFTKITDLRDENGVLLGVKHSWHDEYGWHLCHYSFHNEIHRILQIGNYRFLRKNREKKLHYFITISYDDRDIEVIMKSMERVVRKKWITDYYYVVEQRGITEETCGEGIHVHLLISKNGKRKSQVIREIASTTKLAKNFIDIQEGKTANIYERRKDYMLGKKEGLVKQNRVKFDALFRQKNNLKDIYTNAIQISSSHETQAKS